jgi:hypothetical protein
MAASAKTLLLAHRGAQPTSGPANAASAQLVSDLGQLGGMVNLQSLIISELGIEDVPDLAPLTALVNLQSLDLNESYKLIDLAPLAAMLSLQTLVVRDNNVAPLQNRVDRGELRIVDG